MLKKLSFNHLRIVNRNRCVNGFKHGLDEWTLLEWCGAMCGEAGEAANLAKKIKRIDDGRSKLNSRGLTRDKLLKKLGEELADTVIYVDLIASAAGLRLADLIRDKFNADSIKQGTEKYKL